MVDDFIIQIENSNTFKKYLKKITKDNIYCYWCEKDELEKISSNVELNCSFLSFFLSSKDDKIIELVNNGYIFIFLKNPKILYGIVKVESVIIKNLLKNNYLEEEDLDYNNEIINNKLILIDENKFNDLVKQYKIIEVPKMMFVKFKYMYKFKFEITLKKLNDFTNNSQYKYPRCVQNKEMIKCNYIDFLDNLINFIDDLKKQDGNINNDENTNNKNLLETNIKNNSLNQKFCIPVLWNFCDSLKKKLNKLESNRKQKKFFVSHYNNCKICEINDNNSKFINLLNKDIVIKNINNPNDIKIFDLAIDSYKNLDNLKINEEMNNLNFEKGKINILQCSKSESEYKKCLLIIE